MLLVRCCPHNMLFNDWSLGINHTILRYGIMGIWFNTNLCAQKCPKFEDICLRDKGMFILKRLRKGCNSTTMNFRDMGPFENPLVTHGNIGFNISGPPGLYQDILTKKYPLNWLYITAVNIFMKQNKPKDENIQKTLNSFFVSSFFLQVKRNLSLFDLWPTALTNNPRLD